MSKRSDNYWRNRLKELEDAQYKKTTEYFRDVEKQFGIAQRNIQLDIEHWYQRLADNNDISLAAAQKLLEANELKEFKWTVEDYIRHGEDNAVNMRWMKQLENASAKVHINRLQAMKIQMQQEAEILCAKQKNGLTKFLNQTYEDNFYHTAFEVAKGTGVGSSLSKLDTSKVEKIISTPWGQDEKVFSDRIWEKKEKLVRELHTELTQCIIRGENPDEAAKRLAKKMGSKLSQARTLVYTESAALSAVGQKDSFTALGVEEFEVIETLDRHTCPICGDMDSRHFPMKEFAIGVTAPPFHPRCRGTTCPYFDDEFSRAGERAARGEDGKTYYVPADMTYKDWKKSVVRDEMNNNQGKKTDYLIRSHTPGQNISKERRSVNEAIASVPLKVQRALENTVIDVGKNGASQYDYNHDILYIAKGADKESVIHELGHLAENKIINDDQIVSLRNKVVGRVYPQDIKCKVYYDQAGNPVDIFILEREQFVSEYQGRIYVRNILDAFETDGTIKEDLLWEFVAEPFREYIENPELLKEKHPVFYNLLREALE